MSGLADLVHEFRAARHKPQGALVLLHGKGRGEQDLLPLVELLDPERLLVGVTPRGPLEAPGGGFRWFDVPEVGRPEPKSFGRAFELVDDWLKALAPAVGVPPERTILGGFEEGAVLAWALAARKGRPRPAGLLTMSGFVPAVPGLEFDPENLEGLPILMTHGDQDPVIDVAFARRAKASAEQRGADVTYHESSVPHALDPALTSELEDWVAARFPRPAA